ncbi:hypothetical protein THRCLA_00826 [Thraustotheca clavata]|uniref:PX domain-containing protein n=1 Tax=Thraustotheca clavata TaxID=74557 RepID=A0A1W0AA48_9STRA|nr:hypothetical protein THRCLA_00826 [Thraustotheca clavata]
MMPSIEMIISLHMSVNCYRVLGKTAEFEVACKAKCTTSQKLEMVTVDWSVFKTFEEFQVLDTRLRLDPIYGNRMHDVTFVPLHKAKVFFGQATKKSFLTKRQEALGKYLRQVLSIPDIADFHSELGSKVLADFSLIYSQVVFHHDSNQTSTTHEDTTPLSHGLLSNIDGEASKADESEPADDTRSSDESDETNLTPAQQEELQSLIFQRIEEHSDLSVLKQFQKHARRFGRATEATINDEGQTFYVFMVRSFGLDFCAWLVPSLAQLLPDAAKRRALRKAMEATPTEVKVPEPEPVSIVEEQPVIIIAPPRPRPASDAVLSTPPPFPVRPTRSRPASMSGKEVLAKVRTFVDGDEERISEFKAMTKELRTSRLSASDYSDYVVSTFGPHTSHEVLQDVANAMTNPHVHEELQQAIEVTEQQSAMSSLRASMRMRRNSRRMSLERNSSFISHRSSLSNLDMDEQDEEEPAEEVASQNRVLNRLKHQGAVNLMNFK